MKKINLILFLYSTFLFTGCALLDNMSNNMTNTPTQKVEEYLIKYQKLEPEVMYDVKEFFMLDDVDDDDLEKYEKIVNNNYKKLTYDIKNEEIDGDSAVVKAEINVITYTKVLDEIDTYMNENKSYFMSDDLIDTKIVNEYKLEKLNRNEEKSKYVLEFILVKENKQWKLENLNDEMKRKIYGFYK